jgi:hypothetical protein
MGQNMTALARLLATVAILFVGMTDLATAERRVALVIGNSAYQNTTPLRNPRNDATALAAVLRKLDFEVLEGVDLTDHDFRRIARDFSVKIEDADVALFFYAGHGLQVNNRNYFMPVDAALKREADLDFEAVPLDLVLKQMERGDRTNIVLLDACRNNPLADELARNMGTRSLSLGRGLARVETGVGTYVGFSTQPGNVALDGDGRNSPFTAALLSKIERPGIDIETLMRQVREEVIVATNGKQVPWGNSSLVGKGFFFNPAEPAVAERSEGKPAATPGGPSATDQLNIEIAFWNSIKDSDDPTLLKAYLTEYPSGRFASLALIRLDRLAKVNPKPEPAQPSRQEPAPRQNADAAEEGFWLAAETSGDVKLYKRYVELYPYGAHVTEARTAVEAIETKLAALPPVESAAVPLPRPKPIVRVIVPTAAEVTPVVEEPVRIKKPLRQKKTAIRQTNVSSKRKARRTARVQIVHEPRPFASHPSGFDIGFGGGIGFGMSRHDMVAPRGRNHADTIVGPDAIAKGGGF